MGRVKGRVAIGKEISMRWKACVVLKRGGGKSDSTNKGNWCGSMRRLRSM